MGILEHEASGYPSRSVQQAHQLDSRTLHSSQRTRSRVMRNTFDALGGDLARRTWFVIALAACLASVPSLAFADMILPVAFLAIPGMLLLFVPIVLIEGLVLRFRLGIGFWRSIVVMAAANFVSTVVGIPLVNVAAFPIQNIAFIGNSIDGFWNPFRSLLVLLVPFMLASWIVEYWVARPMLRDVERRPLLIAVLLANVASYALVGVVLVVMSLVTAG